MTFSNLNGKAKGKEKIILKTDISKCFDEINHEVMLKRVVLPKAALIGLRKAVKAGSSGEYPSSENALVTAPQEEKVQIKQQIEDLRREEMRPFEEEYWQLLGRLAQEVTISESEAEAAIAEVVQAVEVLETHPVRDRSKEMMVLLREIPDKLIDILPTPLR